MYKNFDGPPFVLVDVPLTKMETLRKKVADPTYWEVAGGPNIQLRHIQPERVKQDLIEEVPHGTEIVCIEVELSHGCWGQLDQTNFIHRSALLNGASLRALCVGKAGEKFYAKVKNDHAQK